METLLKSSIDINFESLSSIIDKWRFLTFNELPKGVPPHISLLYPWVVGDINKAQIKRLENIIRRNHSFYISFKSVDIFKTGHIVLKLHMNEKLELLHYAILNEFKEYKPYDGVFEKPQLHLTVGYDMSGSNESKLYNDIKNDLCSIINKPIKVNSITVMKEISNNQWGSHQVLKLKG